MKYLIFAFLFLANANFTTGQSSFSAHSTGTEIRNLLEASTPGRNLTVGETSLKQYDLLQEFYANRDFGPGWTEAGRLTKAVNDLIAGVEDSRFDGLQPEDYHLTALKAILAAFESEKENETTPVRLAYVDLVCSDAFFSLSSDLYKGKVSQEAFKVRWEIEAKRVKRNLPQALDEALDSQSITQSLRSFWPRYKVYRSMRNSMKGYFEENENLKEDWKDIGGKPLKVGDKSKNVPVIRERLTYWRDLASYQVEEETTYDSVLMEAVERFQQRNGLDADGIIGKDTYAAMNESPAKMIRKVAVNMERLRWLPDTVLNGRFIMVNIANFQLDYLQDNGLDTLLSSKVIVGKEYHSTPVFNGEMAYIVFSPTWTVPSSIIRREMIPKIKKDASYLSRNHLKILTFSGKEVSPSSVDWSKASSSFPYMIRQSPGPFNSLGQVKFMFPNKHNVYIHDTPSKSLFDQGIRAFSHGCIRVQHPDQLAGILLEGNQKWDAQRIRKAMDAGTETTVVLDQKIPVVLIYLTFWADPSGKAFVRKDIYGRDTAIEKALFID